MIQGFLVWFIKLTPSTKRWFWKAWYNLFANRSKEHSFRFMNYGYMEAGFELDLLKTDEYSTIGVFISWKPYLIAILLAIFSILYLLLESLSNRSLIPLIFLIVSFITYTLLANCFF